MPIEGPLRELGIHDVFQLLDLSRKTGVLRVTSELRHNAGTISFEGGAIIFAEIRSNPHPLGALLLRTGKITEADLERARDMQERQGDGRRLGEILVSRGASTNGPASRGASLTSASCPCWRRPRRPARASWTSCRPNGRCSR